MIKNTGRPIKNIGCKQFDNETWSVYSDGLKNPSGQLLASPREPEENIGKKRPSIWECIQIDL